jgi:hypothetical protein
MVVVQPGKTRSSVVDTPEGLVLSIPARRHPFALLFLPLWLVGWAFGWRMAFGQLTSSRGEGPPDLFLLVWLIGWTAGGVFAIWALAWSLAGREVVTLRPHELILARRILGLGRARRYDLSHVADLRASPESYSPSDFRSSMRFWGVGGGPIAFDYGASTVRFGAGLDEAEARQLVQRLIGRQPSLGRAPS